ncbi:MAG: hypothetical protein M0D55_10115 [Elusimicrobiota bacterium]|nr:MAG: hypothetical protein M0D55_10115 [Elusimicrobiota bacterium]
MQLPGISNSAQAKELVGKTALLEFRMVDDSDKARAAMNKIVELTAPFEGIKPSAAALKLVPPASSSSRARRARCTCSRRTSR